MISISAGLNSEFSRCMTLGFLQYLYGLFGYMFYVYMKVVRGMFCVISQTCIQRSPVISHLKQNKTTKELSAANTNAPYLRHLLALK